MVDIFMGYLCYTGMWQSGAIHMLHGSVAKFRIFPSKKERNAQKFPSKKEMYCNFLEKCKFMLKTHYFHPFLTSITHSLQLNDSFR